MMYFQIPGSLKKEHQEIHAELSRAIETGGQLGSAARIVYEALLPHIQKEEEFALPPLGLLVDLANGNFEAGMMDALSMTERLRRWLPEMLNDHRTIIHRLKHFDDAVKADRRTEFAGFSEKLVLHIQMEEEVFYPATLLVGEYLKAKSMR